MKFNINLALIFSIAMAFGTTWAEVKKEQSKDYRAHSHGNGNLELVIDGNTVRGKFEIPMDILLGFENLPKNAAQKKAVADLQTATASADNFVKLPSAAACSQVAVTAESDMFKGKKSEHSDLNYSFEFLCKNPFELKSIEFVVMSKNAKFKKLKVEMVTPKGQKLTTVEAKKPVLNL
jgi:hypothetical protein